MLVKYITEYGKYDETDLELGYTYRFPSLGLGFWRPVIFEYEMVNNKDFKDMPEEIQLDQMKHLFFEAVCVYVADYYTE